MSYVDLNSPYASAILDGGSGLCGSDIFPSLEEFGVPEDNFTSEQLGSMATSGLVDIQNFLDSIKKDIK